MIKAILFDIGGVILDEEELEIEYLKCAKDILKQLGIEVTDKQFNEAVEQCILNFEQHFTESLMECFVKHDKKKCSDLANAVRKKLKNWSKKHPQKLNPGIKETVKSLAQTYKLALAGNQPSAVKDLLEHYGILEFFTTTEVSEDIGIRKPDPRFFTYILKNLDVDGNETIMIGDRLDNDVIPAKKLGLRTILIKVGIFAVLEPQTPEEIPDVTVNAATELRTAIENVIIHNK